MGGGECLRLKRGIAILLLRAPDANAEHTFACDLGKLNIRVRSSVEWGRALAFCPSFFYLRRCFWATGWTRPGEK